MTTAEPAPDIAQRVLREQVALLYANTGMAFTTDILLAWATGAVFYWQLRNPLVLAWLGLHLLQNLRYPLLWAYHRDPQAGERSAFWARRQCLGLLLYGSVWGVAPWLLLPADNLPMTVLLMLLMMGLTNSCIAAAAPLWASMPCLLLPMALGLVSALAWRGTAIYGFLAGCTCMYLLTCLYFARQQHLLLTRALLARFEKEALAEQLARQIEVSERLSAEKSRFLAAASHDLRQPLHAIALFGAVLEKELHGQPGQPHAQRLMHAVTLLGSSLDGMLDISRLDAGVVAPVLQDTPLNPLLQALQPQVAALAEEKGLQLRLRASPLWVHTDPALLQRLLGNLLDNALKYTHHGGVLLRARSQGAQVWLEVIDTGIGIAPAQQEPIFEEFYQVNNPGRDRSQGLGLGLSIVRRLSVLLQHPVQLHSRPGHGSRFRVVLPQVQPPRSGLAPRKPPILQALPQQVLLVDDEADIGEAMASLLASHGVALRVARNEAQAQAALALHPVQVLVCDYRLADGVDGLAVGLRLRQRFGPQLPLLMVTGETAPERLQRVADSGLPVLFKPVSAEVLLQALADLAYPQNRG